MEAVLAGSRDEEVTLGDISLAGATVRDLVAHSSCEALTLLWGQSLLSGPAWGLSFRSIFDQAQSPLDLTVGKLVPLGGQRGATRPVALVTVCRLPLLFSLCYSVCWEKSAGRDRGGRARQDGHGAVGTGKCRTVWGSCLQHAQLGSIRQGPLASWVGGTYLQGDTAHASPIPHSSCRGSWLGRPQLGAGRGDPSGRGPTWPSGAGCPLSEAPEAASVPGSLSPPPWEALFLTGGRRRPVVRLSSRLCF